MTVCVSIVTWNGERFLPHLLASLRAQTRPPDRILAVDNASSDGTLEVLKQWPEVHVFRNNRNLGFAHGHNQAISVSETEAVLLVNQDLILEPTCIERLAEALAADPRLGSVSPKVYRFSLTGEDLRDANKSGILDAAGMNLRRTRQAVNRGEGSEDHGQYDQRPDDFGAPGVLPMYRRSALEDVRFNREYLDDDFFAYKEDVDLAWRLRWAGWSSRFVPGAVAFHHRTLSHHGDTVTGVVQARRQRSDFLNTLSYRNHLLLLLKNETWGTFLPHLPFILAYELRRIGYLVLRERSTLRAVPQAIRLASRIWKKRRHLSRHRRIGSRAFRRLLTA